MPIPKPKDREDKNEFVSRCMSDKVMVDEYPNSRQRAAICYDAWRKVRTNSMASVFGMLKASSMKKIKV